jgi:hypothetical protein
VASRTCLGTRRVGLSFPDLSHHPRSSSGLGDASCESLKAIRSARPKYDLRTALSEQDGGRFANVAEAVEGAGQANRGAAVNVLMAAVIEAFVSAKLERTDVSTALYAAASEPQGAAIVRKLSKRVHRTLTAALAEAADATLGEMEFVALMLYSAMVGATCAVLEAGAAAKMVAQLREELLVLCQAYAAKSVRSTCVLKGGGAIARN